MTPFSKAVLAEHNRTRLLNRKFRNALRSVPDWTELDEAELVKQLTIWWVQVAEPVMVETLEIVPPEAMDGDDWPRVHDPLVATPHVFKQGVTADAGDCGICGNVWDDDIHVRDNDHIARRESEKVKALRMALMSLVTSVTINRASRIGGIALAIRNANEALLESNKE